MNTLKSQEVLKLDNPDSYLLSAEDINILYEHKNTVNNNS